MSIELIGAGFGRTGTLSLKVALERLGYGPCYHGIEVLREPERARHWLTPMTDGVYDWDTIFRGYRATVDWPASAFWRDLVEHYPNAKVLLSVRDEDSWYDSLMNTIYPSMTQGPPKQAERTLHKFHDMLFRLIFETTFGGGIDDQVHAKQVFRAHNQAVIDDTEQTRLLVYQPGDGWEPICQFLGVPVPDEDFPHLNDRAWYRSRAHISAQRSSDF